MRCSGFLATRLDGHIADESHGIAWLQQAQRVVPPGEDCGHAQFYGSVDALLMGRRTFEQALAFDDWPYGTKPVCVLSDVLARSPARAPESLTLVRGTAQALAQRLANAGYRHLYVDGGTVLRAFIAARLLDELTITRVPVLLGGGVALFEPCPAPV